jgi:ATP-binding cassette subfamily B protein
MKRSNPSPANVQDTARVTSLESRADTESSQISDRYLVWMLGKILAPYRLQIILVFLMLIGVSLLSLLPPYLIQQSVDGPITEGDVAGLIPYGIVFFVSIFVVFGLRFAYTYLLQTVGQKALENLRQSLFEHILSQSRLKVKF